MRFAFPKDPFTFFPFCSHLVLVSPFLSLFFPDVGCKFRDLSFSLRQKLLIWFSRGTSRCTRPLRGRKPKFQEISGCAITSVSFVVVDCFKQLSSFPLCKRNAVKEEQGERSFRCVHNGRNSGK